MRFYLAGGSDRASDGGVGWRDAATKYLATLGHTTLDPTKKPGEGLEAIAQTATTESGGRLRHGHERDARNPAARFGNDRRQ